MCGVLYVGGGDVDVGVVGDVMWLCGVLYVGGGDVGVGVVGDVSVGTVGDDSVSVLAMLL